MLENLTNTREHTPPLPKFLTATLNGGGTFALRREMIFKRLQQTAEQCKLNYSGRKELANETDDTVAELCEALEDAFSYGLRQQHGTVVATAASLFQNMQEIVTGNAGHTSANDDTTFWDFCQVHLTPHERERYEQLKHIWTKCGRGKAFIRASLNESSLQRYILTWLSADVELNRFYTPWSLLLDPEASQQLPHIVANLKDILFALTVDATQLNVARPYAQIVSAPREEPIIVAPAPVPVVSVKSQKRKSNAIERPIKTAGSTEDLIGTLTASSLPRPSELEVYGTVEAAEASVEEASTPCDPIEPELEFLKHPLPDFYPDNHDILHIPNGVSAIITSETAAITASEQPEDKSDDDDEKSDTSSQYSKSSSANCAASQTVLEEKLREMSERCALLETRVAQLSLENRQLVRRLTQFFNESGIDPATTMLVNNFSITIPHVKLFKSKHGTSSYYAYEVHTTMCENLETWSVLRRYNDFFKLHKSLLRTHPSISVVEFPPKKHFGNMNLVFVEQRRQQLLIYLLNLAKTIPQIEACKTKAELQKVFPFLRER